MPFEGNHRHASVLKMSSNLIRFLKLFFENSDTFVENFDRDLEIVETNEVRRFRVVAEEDYTEIQGDYSIQRWDGVEATISCQFGYFTMVVWHVDGNRL
ncbi:Protein CBG12790 [Caenorhabditis briggsae]|uniref:Protein CBG12790 n=1 Tax=Caenorhabditis briggsae TaxID=6238 RepID=A8XGK6_CAEBR|nr:Protein CBG12790 [Caenorhabditis briggsae]CAP31712.1 Protein CBG12790 [Caenorhabditis briggsae]